MALTLNRIYGITRHKPLFHNNNNPNPPRRLAENETESIKYEILYSEKEKEYTGKGTNAKYYRRYRKKKDDPRKRPSSGIEGKLPFFLLNTNLR
jgi:hypothetical protein